MTMWKWFDLPTLQANRVGSIHVIDTSWSSSRPGLGRWIIDAQSRDLLNEQGPRMFRAWLTNQYEMQGCARRCPCKDHIGPGRELSATCEDHLWIHGGSKYFVRKPPLDPSSRYLLELVGMLVPCLYKTWTTASQLTPYPLIAVFTWHLVMNVL